jgi:hypothetical protein
MGQSLTPRADVKHDPFLFQCVWGGCGISSDFGLFGGDGEQSFTHQADLAHGTFLFACVCGEYVISTELNSFGGDTGQSLTHQTDPKHGQLFHCVSELRPVMNGTQFGFKSRNRIAGNPILSDCEQV